MGSSWRACGAQPAPGGLLPSATSIQERRKGKGGRAVSGGMRGPCNALPRLVAALVLCAAWLLRAAQLASSQARVVQGRVAAIEDFAHGAVLLSGGRQWCGAVLLGPRHALTAAHCLDERCANITAHTRCPAAPPPKKTQCLVDARSAACCGARACLTSPRLASD